MTQKLVGAIIRLDTRARQYDLLWEVMTLAENVLLRLRVERRLAREGIDMGRIDVLVVKDVVTITGHFLDLNTRRPIPRPMLQRIKANLMAVEGIGQVVFNVQEPAPASSEKKLV